MGLIPEICDGNRTLIQFMSINHVIRIRFYGEVGWELEGAVFRNGR
jgi:hypothetical protein